MKISARNQLKGKVKKVTEGSVNTEVVIELAPGVEITSMITRTSATGMAITPGIEVYAVIKASDVMVGMDH